MMTDADEAFRTAKRWHWRTWNRLSQVEDATDGDAPFQRGDKDAARGLCMSRDSETMALLARGWVEVVDVAEVCDGDGFHTGRQLPVYFITTAGRSALDRARKEGVQIG
jgi:hypothetical protein